MNYTWDAVLRAQEQGIPRHKLAFRTAKRFSPYMELSFVELNAAQIDETHVLEVNPHYRFEHIFGNLLDVDAAISDAIVQPYLDFALHIVTDAELKRGMGKAEFRQLLLWRDMRDGAFGETAREALEHWKRAERDIVLGALVNQYATDVSLELLKETLRQIYPNLIFYHAKGARNLLLLYMGVPDTREERIKAEALMQLFLPLHFTAEIYYDRHFGIIDVDKVMRIGSMVVC